MSIWVSGPVSWPSAVRRLSGMTPLVSVFGWYEKTVHDLRDQPGRDFIPSRVLCEERRYFLTGGLRITNRESHQSILKCGLSGKEVHELIDGGMADFLQRQSPGLVCLFVLVCRCSLLFL